MIRVRQELCTGCGRCTQVCPTQAMRLSNRRAELDLGRCVGCGQCVAVCPASAIQEVPESIHATVLKLQRLRWQVQMLSDAVDRVGAGRKKRR
jgi:formate hydrogenlyase subunit 6/NADH:ubiquinone oxidoreductase subunit I